MSYRDEYSSLNLDGLREAVMDELASQYSVENLSMEEYDLRCGKAAGSKIRTELVALVQDLPLVRMPKDPRTAQATMPARYSEGRLAASSGSYSLNTGSVQQNDALINVFFGSSRRGPWKPAKTTSIINVFGGTDLDLSQAALPPDGMVIHLICVFGGCDIKLPAGVNVDVRGFGVFGGFDRKIEECDDPNAPTIVIDGIAVFGGCDVRTKRSNGR
jgi:hypothetical protein